MISIYIIMFMWDVWDLWGVSYLVGLVGLELPCGWCGTRGA